MNTRVARLIALLIGPVLFASSALAEDDSFKIKRQDVFEFVRKPAVSRAGNAVTIEFETKGLCDVTVAVEKADGTIIRHVAAGVLGPKAPPPLVANSVIQKIVWDGKDDRGQYVTDPCSVRVSLGLKPQFERTLFWHPNKLTTAESAEGYPEHTPIFCPAPEGVYIYQGGAIDHLRLFDHKGDYVRTVYPFASADWSHIQGLATFKFPQDGATLPLKGGFQQATLLTSGSNYDINSYGDDGVAANALAIRDSTIVLAHRKTNWLSLDGRGRNLEGPPAGVECMVGKGQGDRVKEVVPPRSAALSPDGKWLYLTGYGWYEGWYHRGVGWLHAVMRMPADGSGPMALFIGGVKPADAGDAPEKLRVPSSLAVDAQGRIYVSDYGNNRIQVFSPEAKLLKTIPFKYPAHVAIHHKTGDIYVFSWYLRTQTSKDDKYPTEVTHLGPFDKPDRVATYPLPLPVETTHSGWSKDGGREARVALDSWAENPTIWIAARTNAWETSMPVLLAEKGGKLEPIHSYADEVAKAVTRLKPPVIQRQRLYANPANGRLYIGEGDAGVRKSVTQMLEADPKTGRIRTFELPFDAEDACFGPDGTIYLRTDCVVARYDPANWREIPFDYGEERDGVGFESSAGAGRHTHITSGIIAPTIRPGCFHQGGMAVNASGNLVMTCYNATEVQKRKDGLDLSKLALPTGKRYTPKVYPGRFRGTDIHVWDPQGKVLIEDAVPGLADIHGIGIDNQNDIYVLASPTRVMDGQPLYNDMGCTLVKFRPRKAKVLSTSKTPIAIGESTPKRPPDLVGGPAGQAWIDGAEWFYGDLGFGGFNAARAMGGCACWNCRPALDYFGRSFAPETRHFSVAVLDSAGNPILRIGRYGNIDEGKPLVTDGGPANARSIGGDEVSLFHAAYLATHTDNRLFIADAGNARILAVKLDYRAQERLPVPPPAK